VPVYLTRRSFLRLGLGVGVLGAVGGLGTVALGARHQHRPTRADVLPGATAGPDRSFGDVVTGTVQSKYLGGRHVDFTIVYPNGQSGAALPLVLSLYGRNGDVNSDLEDTGLALPRAQANAISNGAPPFALVTVEAGPSSYWHARADGTDPQTMIVADLLPELARRGLRTDRIGLHGESMGGYGALLLAERLGSTGVAAVVVEAPAIFADYSSASPIAFDSPDDFAAHDVMSAAGKLAGIPIRVVCGTDDPFYPQVQKFVALPHDPAVQTSYERVGHDTVYWRSCMLEQLTFVAGYLST
jgi:hypothetical protein